MTDHKRNSIGIDLRESTDGATSEIPVNCAAGAGQSAGGVRMTGGDPENTPRARFLRRFQAGLMGTR